MKATLATNNFPKNFKLLALGKLEEHFWQKDYSALAGIDEAGRGALAGPVVAAAVILPADYQLFIEAGVKDSKLVSEEKREELEQLIVKEAVSYGVGIISPYEIDRVNILQASRLAMSHAVKNLTTTPDLLLIDGNFPLESPIRQYSLIKGDKICLSIAAASILAKVTRDRIMRERDNDFPDYGFKQHKGYATSVHLKALSQFGPSPFHRHSFSPIKNPRLF